MSEKTEDFLKKEIHYLDLSVRSYNSLIRADVKTIEDITRFSEDELARIKGMGAKSVRETKSALSRHGLFLKSKRENGTEKTDKYLRFEKAEKILNKIRELEDYNDQLHQYAEMVKKNTGLFYVYYEAWGSKIRITAATAMSAVDYQTSANDKELKQLYAELEEL